MNLLVPLAILAGLALASKRDLRFSPPPPLTPISPAPNSQNITPWDGMTGTANVLLGGGLVLFPPELTTLTGATPSASGLVQLDTSWADGRIVFSTIAKGTQPITVFWQEANGRTHSATFNLQIE